MKYLVISKRTGEPVAEVRRMRDAYDAVKALEEHDFRIERYDPDTYKIEEAPE